MTEPRPRGPVVPGWTPPCAPDRSLVLDGRYARLEALDAERTFAEAQAALALADARIADAQVDLFRALGGRWSQG